MSNEKYRNCDIGQIVEGNAYFFGYEALFKQSLESLRRDLAMVQNSVRATRHEFLTHTSVPLFMVTLIIFTVVFVTGPTVKPWLRTLPFEAALLVVGMPALMAMAAAWWMDKSRKSIQDGLKLLRERESRIKSIIAIREAEAKMGVEHFVP